MLYVKFLGYFEFSKILFSLLMGIPIPHTLVQTSKISVGSLSKIVAALYITGRDSRLKSVITHPRCLIKKDGMRIGKSTWRIPKEAVLQFIWEHSHL